MMNRRPLMILRTNVEAPDILIEDLLDSSLTSALTEMRDPSSVHYIPSQYLLYRAMECANRIINRNDFSKFIETFHAFKTVQDNALSASSRIILQYSLQLYCFSSFLLQSFSLYLTYTFLLFTMTF